MTEAQDDSLDAKAERLLAERGEDGASVAEVAYALGEDRSVIRQALRRLSRRGTVVRIAKDVFAAAEAGPTFRGVVEYVGGGGGWLVREPDADVELNVVGIGDAMPGDVVEGRVIATLARGRRVGAVDEVVTAAPRRVRVTVRPFRGAWVGEAAELTEPVWVEPAPAGTRRGDVQEVDLLGRADWKRGPGPLPSRAIVGRPVVVARTAAAAARPAAQRTSGARSMSAPGVPTTAGGWIDHVVASLEIPTGFSEEVLREVANVAAPDAVVGDDLTELPLVTIDGADAKDFDDAVFAEPAGAGYRLVVAVADVSSYVPVDSALDLEACARGCSVYLPGRVYPMLPSALSDDVCSLRPDVLRRCAWVELTLGPRGAVLRVDAGFGTMRSRARLTYEQVEGFLNHGDATLAPEVVESLHTLERVRRALHRRRRTRGMLDLDLPEVAVALTDDGQHIDGFVARARLRAHRLIEECMLAANEAVAGLLLSRGWPGIYRVHGDPDEGKLKAFQRIARVLAPQLRTDDLVDHRGMNRLLEAMEGTPRGRILSMQLLRSLPRAEYSTEANGHFGLGTREYLHFTSPIRRYPDLEVHRVLRAMLSDEPLDEVAHEALLRRLVQSAARANDGEEFATKAERTAEKHLAALAMASHVGETFDATVTEVARFGVFVAIEQPYVQGLLPLRELGTEYFEFDEHRKEVRGQRTGRMIRLGDAMRVQCVAVDVLEGHINFREVEPEGFDPPFDAGRGDRSRSTRRKSARGPAPGPKPGKSKRPKGGATRKGRR